MLNQDLLYFQAMHCISDIVSTWEILWLSLCIFYSEWSSVLSFQYVGQFGSSGFTLISHSLRSWKAIERGSSIHISISKRSSRFVFKLRQLWISSSTKYESLSHQEMMILQSEGESGADIKCCVWVVGEVNQCHWTDSLGVKLRWGGSRQCLHRRLVDIPEHTIIVNSWNRSVEWIWDYPQIISRLLDSIWIQIS